MNISGKFIPIRYSHWCWKNHYVKSIISQILKVKLRCQVVFAYFHYSSMSISISRDYIPIHMFSVGRESWICGPFTIQYAHAQYSWRIVCNLNVKLCSFLCLIYVQIISWCTFIMHFNTFKHKFFSCWIKTITIFSPAHAINDAEIPQTYNNKSQPIYEMNSLYGFQNEFLFQQRYQVIMFFHLFVL